MDLFEILSEYHSERPLTKEEKEQNQKYLLSHPLFMKDLPQDIQKNEHLSALMAMKEDQDPNETAENLNKQANKKLKQNPELLYNMKQAYKKYTEAINLKCSNPSINAKLHANRAQINMKLKNYGKVINDCKLCIGYDPNYVKGYYRYAKALILLEKFDECIKLLEPRKQQELKELIIEAKNKNQKKINEQNKKKAKKQQTQNEILKYCQQKGWKYFKRDQPLPQGVRPNIVQGTLSVPLVIIYPQFGQFDLVASTLQGQKIKQHIKKIIEPGLPWDATKQYNMDNIEIYSQLSEAVLLKVPKQAKITDILSRVPIRQALQVQVVSKDNKFYKTYIPQHKII